MEPRQCAHLRVREEAPGCGARWRLSRLLSGSVGTSFAMTAHAFLWGADGAVAMLEDVAHGHYGTGLISRATAEMLREKHVRRRAGVAWGTRRLVEALPVPKSESAPKSDSKSNSAPASSSPAARSDEEVDRGANEEVDDEATARTGKVRAAARRSHFTQSRAG